MLNQNDCAILMSIINSSSFKGSDVETIASLKAKLSVIQNPPAKPDQVMLEEEPAS